MNKRNILEYLQESARLFPEKNAFIGEGCALSFSEVLRCSRAIGSCIASKGLFRCCIAVIMERSPNALCAFFGIMFSGCFYVCIDKDAPEARKIAVLERSRARAVIVCGADIECTRILSGRAEIICYEDAASFETDDEILGQIDEKRIDSDLAYITFTSGSSGAPKGVCTPHRALVDYAMALSQALPFCDKTVFGNQAPLYYDAPMKEILPTVVLGASTVFIPGKLFLFPTKLLEFICDHGINTLCWTSSAFASVSMLGALEARDLSQLRLICHGSEVFPRTEYEKWRTACPNAMFVNLYGPTEATGMSAYWIANRVLDREEAIPIGKAFANTEIFLIDENGKESMCGEIYIRGSCLSLGYFNDRDISESVFVPDPRNPHYRETVYRTGDVGRINEHGELVYVGRLDRQVKIMGRRIEMGEIEVCAERHPSVSMARCVYDKEKGRIVLGYVGECEERLLFCYLRDRLPQYMLPRTVSRLASIPVLPNRKTDMRKLENILLGGANE